MRDIRRRVPGRGQLLACAACAGLLTLPACGGDSGGSTTKPKSTVPTTTVEKLPARLRVGQSATVAAQTKPGQAKTQLRIRLIRVSDPASTSQYQDDQIKSNERYVNLDVELRNLGKVRWSASPYQFSTLLTTRNTRAKSATILTTGDCGTFPFRVDLTPGTAERGCLTYVIRRNARPRLYQFSPDFPDTPPAEWLLIAPRAKTKSQAKTTPATKTTGAAATG